MVYESIVEKLFDEENDDIIELVQDGGQVVKFEQIAVVIYNTEYYAILRPLELKENDEFVIKGEQVEKLFRMTKFNTEESMQRFAKKLRKMGIDEELEKMGINEGDIIRILDYEFEYTK